jgi:transposase
MNRPELERLSKEELIELVLRLQRPGRTSQTSSKPPSSDEKKNGEREASKPGGAKPGHEGHSRKLADAPDRTVDYRPEACPACAAALPGALSAVAMKVYEEVELPLVQPAVTHHRRLQVTCPSCGAHAKGPLPPVVKGSLFGPRLHGLVVYLKTMGLFSYERMRRLLHEVFGLAISEGGIMNILKRGAKAFAPAKQAALAKLRQAQVIESDETGVRIEGVNAYHWVFAGQEAVVHEAAFSRGAKVARAVLDGHKPQTWVSDGYSAQKGHAARQQTCLAHLARHVAYGLEASRDDAPKRLKRWLDRVFAFAAAAKTLSPGSLARRRRALDDALADILRSEPSCGFARELLAKIANARDQVFTFCDDPARIPITNNRCERLLRPAVIQRKVTNGYRSEWAAHMEAAVRTAADTAALAGHSRYQTMLAAFRR